MIGLIRVATRAFQSTLPYGSDLKGLTELINSYYFNPRSLTGATFDRPLWRSFFAFQSTLPYGSDLFVLHSNIIFIDFNPRSLTGATGLLSKFLRKSLDFNPRSLTGATITGPYAPTFLSFQSTLPYGSDPC